MKLRKIMWCNMLTVITFALSLPIFAQQTVPERPIKQTPNLKLPTKKVNSSVNREGDVKDRGDWARISCRGPLDLEIHQVTSGPTKGTWIINVDFKGVSGKLRPGQCSRETRAGWNFPRALGPGNAIGKGRLEYQIRYLAKNNRPFVKSVSAKDGELVKFRTNLSGFDSRFVDIALTTGSFYVSARWTDRGASTVRVIPRIYEVRRVNR